MTDDTSRARRYLTRSSILGWIELQFFFSKFFISTKTIPAINQHANLHQVPQLSRVDITPPDTTKDTVDVLRDLLGFVEPIVVWPNRAILNSSQNSELFRIARQIPATTHASRKHAATHASRKHAATTHAAVRRLGTTKTDESE